MKFTIQNGILTECRMTPDETHVTIPEGVRMIAERAFQGLAMETVTFPEGLRIIREEAFADCTALREVRLPSSLMQTGRKAFAGCTALTAFYVPESLVIYEGEELTGCTSLRTIHIFRGDNVYAIPIPPEHENDPENSPCQTDSILAAVINKCCASWMFSGCGYTRTMSHMIASGLDRGGAVNEILNFAEDFFDALITNNDTESLRLLLASGKVLGEQSIIGIPEEEPESDPVREAFMTFLPGFSEVTDSERPASVDVTEKVEKPEKAIKVEKSEKMEKPEKKSIMEKLLAFSEPYSDLHEQLLQVKPLPERPKPFTIEDGILVRCNDRDAKELTIPDGVTAIEGRAFAGCEHLERLYIPDSLQHIGYCAFCGIPNLKTIVPESLRETRGQGAVYLFPEGLKTIGMAAFVESYAVVDVKLPSTLVGIGNEAFYTHDIGQFEMPYEAECLGNGILYDSSVSSITIFKKDGRRYKFPCEFKNYAPPDLINMIMKKDFSSATELSEQYLNRLLTQMLITNFDEGKTAEFLLNNPELYIQPIIRYERTSLIEALINSGHLEDPGLQAVLLEIVACADQPHLSDMRRMIVNALQEKGIQLKDSE